MIELKNISRKFADKYVVKNLNLKIKSGVFFGLLGPNGAGKTTTIRMMLTLLRPTGGKILIEGKDLKRNMIDYKRKLGLVAQHISLEKEMSARENLELHGRLHNLKKEKREKRIKELMDFVGLWKHRDKLIKQMSGGMKRRLMIARAIMHKPKILFMDEPTVGLDPASRRKIWDLLKDLNANGITIFMTTHYIEEAEILCEDIALMDEGKIIARGTPTELKSRVGRFVLETFNNGKTEYKFFEKREKALDFANELGGNVMLRENTLEDVFIKLTDHGVGD